jgi:hypothetical protein
MTPMMTTQQIDLTEEYEETRRLAEKIAKEHIAPSASERDLMAVNVTDKAIQVLGGHGYCRDYVVERLFRDARGLMLHFKTSEWLRQGIAKAALGL